MKDIIIRDVLALFASFGNMYNSDSVSAVIAFICVSILLIFDLYNNKEYRHNNYLKNKE